MPQAGDDVELMGVPDRCGYAFTPGWAYESVPAYEEVIIPEEIVPNPHDPENPIVIPAVTQTVPAVWVTVPPRARVLKTDLTEQDIGPGQGALIAELEAALLGVREAWGCPDFALVLPSYRFDV